MLLIFIIGGSRIRGADKEIGGNIANYPPLILLFYFLSTYTLYISQLCKNVSHERKVEAVSEDV